MPRKLHRKLAKVARRRGYSDERADRYIYGTLNRMKMRHKEKRKRK